MSHFFFRSSNHAKTIDCNAYLEFEASANLFSIWTDDTMTLKLGKNFVAMYLYKERSESRFKWDSVLVYTMLQL